MAENVENKEMDFEETVMTLVSTSGSAHACSIEAIRKARTGDFKAADEIIAEGQQALQIAHDLHFRIMKNSMKDPGAKELSLLLTHAQDHLMNAQTSSDLAKEIIEICKIVIK